MAPELNEKRDSFDPNHSEVFALKDDWLAIIHYGQALAALEKNNKGDFKKHITEAFWLSPRQAQAFGPHIERLQLEEAMQSVKLPPHSVTKISNRRPISHPSSAYGGQKSHHPLLLEPHEPRDTDQST